MAHLHPHRGEDDQVFQKYLDRAITDIHVLGDEIEACGLCDHDGDRRVLGTGHPLADVMLLKWKPTMEELDEGVAFHGRTGEAIRASMARLAVDPLDLYGTVCIKCSAQPTPCMRDRCPEWLLREIRIVEPRMIVVLGHEALATLNGLDVQGAERVDALPGDVQTWTHACDVLWCPDIDEALDRPASKQAFWRALRSLGDWYSDKPPF